MAKRTEAVKTGEWKAVALDLNGDDSWALQEGFVDDEMGFVPDMVTYQENQYDIPMRDHKHINLGGHKTLHEIMSLLREPQPNKMFLMSAGHALRLEEKEGNYFLVQGWLEEDGKFRGELIVREWGPEKLPKLCARRIKLGDKDVLAKIADMMKDNFCTIME